MARAVEPFRGGLPERFLRWIETLRARIFTIPCFTEGNGTPEGVLDGQRGDRYYRLDGSGNTLLYLKTTDVGNTGWQAYGELMSTDFYLEVVKGNVSGHSAVLIRGHNPNQSAASGFVDIAEFGSITYLAAAETMNIASTSAADAAAGTGARTVLVQGVDNTGAALEEVVAMNGTTNVLTVGSYLRVNSIVALTAGSGGFNAGNITATASAAGTVQDEMDAGEGVSQSSHYTVPLGKTLNLLRIELNAARISGGGTPELEFQLLARPGGDGAAWQQLFDKTLDTSVVDELDVELAFPEATPIARTDLRLRSDTDTNNTECRIRLYGILVDD